MSLIHCPRCGSTADASALDDAATVTCRTCHTVYSPADGQIWNVAIGAAIATLSRHVHWQIETRNLDAAKYKAAVAAALTAMWGAESEKKTEPETAAQV